MKNVKLALAACLLMGFFAWIFFKADATDSVNTELKQAVESKNDKPYSNATADHEKISPHTAVLTEENCDLESLVSDTIKSLSVRNAISESVAFNQAIEANLSTYSGYDSETLEVLVNQRDVTAHVVLAKALYKKMRSLIEENPKLVYFNRALQYKKETVSNLSGVQQPSPFGDNPLDTLEIEKMTIEIRTLWQRARELIQRSFELGSDRAASEMHMLYLTCQTRVFCEEDERKQAELEIETKSWQLLAESRNVDIIQAIRHVAGDNPKYPKWRFRDSDKDSENAAAIVQFAEKTVRQVNEARRENGLHEFVLGIERLPDYKAKIQPLLTKHCNVTLSASQK